MSRQNGSSIAGDIAVTTAAVIRRPVNANAITLMNSHRGLAGPVFLIGFTIVGTGVLRFCG